MKRFTAVFCLLCMTALLFTGCGTNNPVVLVNIQEANLTGIQSIHVNYDADDVYLCAGSTGGLVIKEYMNRDSRSLFARVETLGSEITIQEGRRSLLSFGHEGFVEIYLPLTYFGALQVHTASGQIETKMRSLQLGAFSADSTSGEIHLGTVQAESCRVTTTSGSARATALTGDAYVETTSGRIEIGRANGGGSFEARTTSGALVLGDIVADSIRLRTTSGSISCVELEGEVDFETTSGSLDVENALGSGRYVSSSSGDIAVTYSALYGDVSMENKNGSLALTLPAGAGIQFEAATREGRLDISFADALQTTEDGLAGELGTVPRHNVRLETRSGNITVRQTQP